MNLMGCGQAVGITNTGLGGDFGAQEPSSVHPHRQLLVWILDLGFDLVAILYVGDFCKTFRCFPIIFLRKPTRVGGFIIPLVHIPTYIS